MSKSKVVKIGDVIADRVRALLNGLNPTPKRIEGLLVELEQRRKAPEVPMPLDPGDIEQGRTVHRPQDHARLLNQNDPENLDAAMGNLEAARREREVNARERIQDRIMANEAKGLHRNAPPIEEDASEERPADPEPAPVPPPPPDPEPEREPQAEQTDEAAEIEAVKRAGMKQARRVFDTLERKTLQQMPSLIAARSKKETLEEAAAALIGELEPNHQDAIQQVCLEQSLPNWVVLLGAIARMADLQELNAGEFRDEWVNRPNDRLGRTAQTPKIEACQLCGGVIPNARRGQQYCCNKHGSGLTDHSDGCGLAGLKMVKGKWVEVATA